MLVLPLLLLAQNTHATETTLNIASVRGVLEEEAVQPTARRHALEVSRCLSRHLPDSDSTLTLSLTAQRGRVRPDSVAFLAPPGAPGLTGCIVPKVYLWDFPFTLRTTDIRLELGLVRESTPAEPMAAADSDIARLAQALEAQGRLVHLTPDLLAVLRGEDLCGQSADEFAAARCAETRAHRQATVEAALADGWLHVHGLEARLGTWDAATERFVTLYGLDVEAMALGFVDPDTGEIVARWHAPGINAEVQDTER
jgi:hypothetical protein